MHIIVVMEGLSEKVKTKWCEKEKKWEIEISHL